jgi:hypothetical protein
MKANKLLRKYWFAIVIVAFFSIVAFFYPKYSGYAYGGLTQPGAVLHREEYSCFGYKYVYSETCMDCPPSFLCVGVPYEKKCYEWVAGTPQSSEKEISCNWQFNYCVDDSNCIPAQCCHPTSCINRDSAPNCEGVVCTLECRGGTMDCGYGYCACVDNRCQAVFTKTGA